MESKENDLSEFAHALGHVQGYIFMALEDDSKLFEFTARGVSRSDLKNLSEECQKIAQSFYNEPLPH